LSLTAGNRSEKGLLQFSFKKLSLLSDPIPEHDAISYASGSPDVRKDVVVDGHRISVPQDTQVALRRLCWYKGTSRLHRFLTRSGDEIVLWIDAVCVNQANLSERSQQLLC
jgi:hypothetical protein